jgi:hypothetical protein
MRRRRRNLTVRGRRRRRSRHGRLCGRRSGSRSRWRGLDGRAQALRWRLLRRSGGWVGFLLSLATKMLAHLLRSSLVNGTGVGLFFGYTNAGKQFDDYLGLDFQFTSQFIDADLMMRFAHPLYLLLLKRSRSLFGFAGCLRFRLVRSRRFGSWRLVA